MCLPTSSYYGFVSVLVAKRLFDPGRGYPERDISEARLAFDYGPKVSNSAA